MLTLLSEVKLLYLKAWETSGDEGSGRCVRYGTTDGAVRVRMGPRAFQHGHLTSS